MDKFQNRHIKLYDGFGHTHDLVLFGHVFDNRPVRRKHYRDGFWHNAVHLVKLFFKKPVPHVLVELEWGGKVFQTRTASDGFIRLEWDSAMSVPAGWHDVSVTHHVGGRQIVGSGRVFVPHITQYGFISDIDDTVLVSHSASIIKRLRELLTLNPRTRDIFSDVAEHYRLLATSNTTDEAPNPFFYVSSSEWNLYDYLVDFFDFNEMPRGAFLLNHVKRWYEFIISGKTGHNGKLLRIARVLQIFPNQQFILLGDNSQQDPVLYDAIARKYPDRVRAVYVRNARASRAGFASQLLSTLQADTGIECCFFRESSEAIQHSRKIGLIT